MCERGPRLQPRLQPRCAGRSCVFLRRGVAALQVAPQRLPLPAGVPAASPAHASSGSGASALDHLRVARAPTASPLDAATQARPYCVTHPAVHLAAFACATARAPRAVDQAVMADPLHSPARYTLINRATEQRAPLPARQHRRPQPHPRRAGLGGRAAQPRVGQGGAAR